jgi:hypothetical protein
VTIETIDAAILAHQTWVARFRTSLKGINTESFDIGKAKDDAACVLGKWLLSERSRELLGAGLHHQIVAIHATFHEIAGNIAQRLNHHESGQVIEEWMAEFNNLSSHLVMLLMLTKKKM